MIHQFVEWIQDNFIITFANRAYQSIRVGNWDEKPFEKIAAGGFGLALLLLCGAGTASDSSTQMSVENKRSVDRTLQVKIGVENTEGNLLQQRSPATHASAYNTIAVVGIGCFLSFSLLFAVCFLLRLQIKNRKQAEAALQEKIAMQRAILSSANYTIISTGLDGTIRSFNPAAERSLGYTASEIIGLTTPMVFHDPTEVAHRARELSQELGVTIEPNFEVFAVKARRGEVEEQEWTYIRKDGSRFAVLLSMTALHDDKGNIIGFVGIGNDITERKQAEQQLRETSERISLAKAELARATRFKDEFLANMSHELRTPLNAILGLSEALQEEVYGLLNEKQHNVLTTIEQSGKHLLELITDILDLSEIESGKMELHKHVVFIQELCESSLTFVKEQAERKNIKLSLDVPKELVNIEADDRRMRQVLSDLLSNAVKFTPEGGSVSLEAKADSFSETVSFSVTDNGIGIAPDNLDKLFKPFVQLDSSLSRRYSGTGLGLVLVRRITELHGGSVSLESQVGKGSRFTVTLPWNQSDMMVETANGASISLPLPEIHAVLVVEDSNPAALQVTRYLAELGAKTVIYPEGEGAVNVAEHMKPDAIVLDLLLPDCSGWDVLAKLKENPNTQNIPVLVVSVVDERAYAIAHGAAEYLLKPFSRQQLLSALIKILPSVTAIEQYIHPSES